MTMMLLTLLNVRRSSAAFVSPRQRSRSVRCSSRSVTTDQRSDLFASRSNDSGSSDKGKLLVLGGTGYLGQTVCQKAMLEGYSVVSVSRRGLPPTTAGSPSPSSNSNKIEYRQGDARQKQVLTDILSEGGFTGVIHCIGLLFDDASGLGSYNRFVSGSGSLPDSDSTYDTITRLTAFNAIEAATDYAITSDRRPLPFCFTSAAEAGWPQVTGGQTIERLMPDFIHRYMVAKRAVEDKLLASEPTLRPIIVRPSLIYSFDRPGSLPSVAAFTLFNKIGLPFVDRPVSVQALAFTMVRAMGRESIKGVLRYPQIDEFSA